MPRPKTKRDYRDLIDLWAAEGWKPASIHRLIEEQALEAKADDCPSEATVRRYYGEWLKLPEHERRERAFFHWPKTMEIGALPWEAGRAAMDLLRFRDERGWGRPTVRQVKWYWRVRLSSPDVDVEEAYTLAATLAAAEHAEATGEPIVFDPEPWEWRLAYQPWRSDDDLAAWKAATGRPENPVPSNRTIKLNGDSDVARDFLEARFGLHLAARLGEFPMGSTQINEGALSRDQEGETADG